MHSGGADADALLAAAHPHAVELRAVEQLAEDQRDLLFDDARPVVLHADLVAVLADALDVDPDFGQDAGLFAGVQGVVDGLLDGGQQGLARVVETQQVPILGEKLADGDVALAGGHRLGGGPATGRARAGRQPIAADRLGRDSTLGVELTVNLGAPSIALEQPVVRGLAVATATSNGAGLLLVARNNAANLTDYTDFAGRCPTRFFPNSRHIAGLFPTPHTKIHP